MPKVSLDTTVVFIDIEVADPEKAILLYDVIQVWRSPDNIQPYVEITASNDIAAQMDGTIDGTWLLNGKVLTVVKNSADPVSITFDGPDPYDLHSVINKINSVIPKLASQAGANVNRVRLTSDLKGLASNLLVSGTAVAVLGLPTTRIVGKAHRIELTTPTNKYRFFDLDGQLTYYYKVRFHNSFNGAVSSFSSFIQATSQPVLAPSDLVTASVRLADETGMPIEGRRIIIVPIVNKKVSSTSLLSTQNRIILKTDQFGFASTKIAKGITARVFFEGTGFEREIIVPNTDFDIMDVATTYPDPFNIVTVPPQVVRTN